MGAFRIEEEQKDPAMLEVKGLTVDDDRSRRLKAGLLCDRHPIDRQRENAQNAEDDKRPAEGEGFDRPQSGEDGEHEHGGVADEECGSDDPLEPGKATAIGSTELIVKDGKVDHESDQHQRCKPCTPAPPSRDDEHNAGPGFNDPGAEGDRQGQEPDEGLDHTAVVESGTDIFQPRDDEQHVQKDSRNRHEPAGPGGRPKERPVPY